MKTYLTKAIACAIVITSCFSCTVESVDNSINNFDTTQEEFADTQALDPCSGDNPKVRLTNNGTVTVDLEIYTIEGVLLNHQYGILPGNVSDWKFFVPGETLFSVTNTEVADEKIMQTMGTCMEYDMEVDINNQLTDAEPVQL